MPLGSAERRKSSTKLDVWDGSVGSRLFLRRAAGALLLAGACTGLQASSLAAAAGFSRGASCVRRVVSASRKHSGDCAR